MTRRTTGSAGGEAYCDLSCTTNADCGVANASCVEGFCDFPVVEPTECDPANTDPVDPASCGGMPDNCRPIDSFLICVLPCEADADCLVDTLFCTGIDDDGGKYCQPEPFSCTAGSACPGGVGVCNATGDGCTCSSDADCTANDLACHMIG